MTAPGLIIAATTSGAGKTTITTGIIRALSDRGHSPAAFKVGPDFIDPSYLAAAAGRPAKTLDVFMSGEDLIAPLYRAGATDADIALIEGVAGLFDGERLDSDRASTAHVAKLLGLPVVLVVNACDSGRSIGAIVTGFRDFDPEVKLAGVILNRVWSQRSARAITKLLSGLGVTVLGAIPHDASAGIEEIHLGLIPGQVDRDRTQEYVAAVGALVAAHVDIDALPRIAQPVRSGPAWKPPGPITTDHTIALASGPAFSFCYPENLRVLESLGARIVRFDPLVDELPAADGVYLCGGFPELYGAQLARNGQLRRQIAQGAAQGLPIVAECGGLMYLCESLDAHAMCAVIPYTATMSARLRLSYVRATAVAESPLTRVGDCQFGQVFHHSRLDPTGSLMPSLWDIDGIFATGSDGVAGPTIAASYVHTHWARDPTPAVRLLSS